jgi:uncharacterized protein
VRTEKVKKIAGALSIICFLIVDVSRADTAISKNRIAYKQTPVDIAKIENIGGFVGQRMKANLNGSVKVFDIEKYARMVEEKKHTDWWWIGEQPGKWLESAIWNSVRVDDQELSQKTEQILARLIAAQEPGGYLGITSPKVRTPEKPLRGMDAYELYFMMHGLLTASEQLNSQPALDCASNLANYFVSQIGPGKAEFYPSHLRFPENIEKEVGDHSDIAGHGVHYSWEGTLLIDPMLRLYQLTGNDEYLEWCRWVIGSIDKWSGWDSFSKLDKVASGEMGIHEIQPYVHSHTFQMNFLGFLRMYQITGDKSYLNKVVGAWEDITKRQMYITGGVSVSEHYERGYIKPITGHSVETCANMSWLEMNQALLELTGDLLYADVIERLLFNHVFAAQVVDGECNRYHTPPNGAKPQSYFHGPDCCSSSGHRQISMLPKILFTQDEQGIFINQYVPAIVAIDHAKGRIKFHLETKYPELEKIAIHIDSAPSQKVALKVRIPGWCNSPSVRVNGKKIGDVKKSAYTMVNRIWRQGDKIELDFPMQPHWIERPHHAASVIEKLKGGDWEQMHREVEQRAPFALVRGPLVYAFDTVWWDDANGPAPRNADNEIAVDRSAEDKFDLSPAPLRTLGPAIKVPLVNVNGESFGATMLPFANIGVWYREGEKKPEKDATAFSYAAWIFDKQHPRFDEIKERQKSIQNAVDYIEIGNAASEKAHDLKGGSGGEFNNRAYRHARYPNQISCRVKVLPESACELACTWWGSDTNRTFDIFAGDQKIATVKLDNNHPEKFYRERYPIPLELVKGKTDAFGQKRDHVELRFVPHKNSFAGGIFEISVEERKK